MTNTPAGEPTNLWDRYFFLPERPEPLAVCRALFCGLILVYYAGFEGFLGWRDVVPAYHDPVGFWNLLPGHVILPDWVMAIVAWLWRLSLLTAAVGLFTRVSLWVAFAGAFYLLGLSTGFGKVSHSEPTVVFVLLILALSRCGDAVSLDTRLGLRRRSHAASGEYRWPVRLVWIMMAIVFAFAGWQKVFRAGLGWMSPDSFTPLMLAHYYENAPPTDLGLKLAWFRPFVYLAAVSTIVGECLFPLALFSRRARLIFVGLMFGMQVNITLLFGVYFWPFLPGYLFFVPWAWLMYDRRVPYTLPWLRRRQLSKGAETIDARPAAVNG